MQKPHLLGQGASEYLILLAIVLIIAMVSLALLGNFAGMGGDAKASESRQFWMSTPRPFTIQESSQQGSTLYLTFQNVQADRYVLTDITAGDSSLGVTNTPYLGGNVVFKGGDKRLVTLNMSTPCSTTYDTYEYMLNITYNSPNLNDAVYFGTKPLVGPCVQ